MKKINYLLTFSNLQPRDYKRHPLLIDALNDRCKIEIYNLNNLIHCKNNSLDKSFRDPKISVKDINKFSDLIKILITKKSFCLYRVPELFTKINEYLVTLFISLLSKECTIHELNPPPDTIIANKNYYQYIFIKYSFLKDKRRFYYFYKIFLLSILYFSTTQIKRFIPLKKAFVSGLLLEEKYKKKYNKLTIIRTPSFDYYKFINKKNNQFKSLIPKNNPSLFYIDGGHLLHSDQINYQKSQDCSKESWENLLRSLFKTYRNYGYKIFVFKHPNLSSSFYTKCEVTIENEDLYSTIENSTNEDLIISSSLTLSLLLPLLNRKFAILFDKSIYSSRLYPDILALKSLFPKNTFIKNKVESLLYHSKVDSKSKEKIKDLFLN